MNHHGTMSVRKEAFDVYFVSSSGYITEHSRPLQWSAIVLYKEISNFKSGIVSERIDLSDF